MDATAHYRYDAVRYFPAHSELYPIQILSSNERTDVPQSAVVQLSLEEAVDLYNSLGLLIVKGATDE